MEESCAPYKSLGFYQILRLLVGTILGPFISSTIGNSPCQKPQPIFNHDFDVKVFLERGVSTASKRCPDFFDALASKQRPYTLVTWPNGSLPSIIRSIWPRARRQEEDANSLTRYKCVPNNGTIRWNINILVFLLLYRLCWKIHYYTYIICKSFQCNFFIFSISF